MPYANVGSVSRDGSYAFAVAVRIDPAKLVSLRTVPKFSVAPLAFAATAASVGSSSRAIDFAITILAFKAIAILVYIECRSTPKSVEAPFAFVAGAVCIGVGSLAMSKVIYVQSAFVSGAIRTDSNSLPGVEMAFSPLPFHAISDGKGFDSLAVFSISFPSTYVAIAVVSGKGSLALAEAIAPFPLVARVSFQVFMSSLTVHQTIYEIASIDIRLRSTKANSPRPEARRPTVLPVSFVSLIGGSTPGVKANRGPVPMCLALQASTRISMRRATRGKAPETEILYGVSMSVTIYILRSDPFGTQFLFFILDDHPERKVRGCEARIRGDRLYPHGKFALRTGRWINCQVCADDLCRKRDCTGCGSGVANVSY